MKELRQLIRVLLRFSAGMFFCAAVLVCILFFVQVARCAPAPFLKSNRCRAHEHRCELRCNEDTPGGSLRRLLCYDKCRERESECNMYGDDEP